jgi:hypothetical protein
MAQSSKLPENSVIEYLFESSDHSDSPQISSIYAGLRSFAGRTKKIMEDFYIVHFHANNDGGLSSDGFPEAIEITFLKKSLLTTPLNFRDRLPINGLDQPNGNNILDFEFEFE